MPRPLTALLDLLAPARCLVCGMLAALPWCPACAREVDRLRVTDACRRCGLTDAAGQVHPCWGDPAPVASTVAAFDYRGAVAATVVAAKVDGARAAWPSLGARLSAAVAEAHEPRPAVVTWVPTDPRRGRDRGVDHAAALARAVARRIDRPATGLVGVRGAPDQGARPVHDRPRIPAGTYRPTAALEGVDVLLVDDVLTTGATARAVSGALRRAGAGTVRLAVLARAGAHELAA